MLLLLRRRRWIIILATLLGAGISFSQALVETPVYVAAAELEIEPPSSSAFGSISGSSLFTEQELETQVRVLSSEQVAERVAENLALSDPPRALIRQLTVAPLGETRVLLVAVSDFDPQRAADLAEGFANAYLEWRREDAVARLVESTTTLRSRQAALQIRLDELDALIGVSQGDSVTVLAEERAEVANSLTTLETQLLILSDEDAFVRDGGQILRHATVPGNPTTPRPMRSLVLGLLFGLAAGVLIAAIRERLDDSVNDDAAVVAATGGRPILAHVPWHEEADEGRLVALVAPAAPASEAFRALRTNIRFAAGDAPFRSIVVTSALEGEGKSTIAANYAITAARAGYSTLLVDADMRQPRLHTILALDRAAGLSRVITRQLPVEQAFQATSVPGLEVMAAGPTPPNPAELLGSQGMVDLLAELDKVFDLIVLDAPPVLPVADALELGTVADTTLLVIHALDSHKRPVAAAVDRLNRVGSRLAGVVLTAVDPRGPDYYVYGGHQEYGGYGTTAEAANRASVIRASSAEEPLWARDREPRS